MTLSKAESLARIQDPKFYLESFVKIKPKAGGLVPFVLNEAQKDLFNTVRKNNRIIILKSRQLGMSTAMCGYIYHYAITHPGSHCGIIGYNGEMVAELLDKIKTFYQTTPPELQPTVKYDSKTTFSFPQMKSKITVLSSSDNVGRGYTFQILLLTELAFWDGAAAKLGALESSAPIDGKIIIESTPNGFDGAYHRTWMSDNDYVKKTYGYEWAYSEEQLDQIRRRMNNPRLFSQEYLLEFLSSGRGVFDVEVIRAQRKNVLKVGDVREFKDGTKFTVYEKDSLTVYREPEVGSIYSMGCDSSEGLDGGDYSVATVLDRVSGEEVARFRKKVPPDVFAQKVDAIGRLYNNALCVLEINNHGMAALLVLKQLLYPSIYFRPAKYDAYTGAMSDRIGWKTTKLTRPLLIDDFAQACRDKVLTLHSKELVDEMSVFVYDDAGAMSPQGGFHDDHIFATGIAFQGFKNLHKGSVEQIDLAEHYFG